MGAILSYPDRTIAGTLSGGNWNTSFPLANLQNDQLSVKAHSTNATAAYSQLKVDIGATARAIRCIGVLSHNISFAGTIRVRGYSDSGYTTMVTGADSGTQYAYPQSLTAESAADYPEHWIYAFTSSKTARYWLVEIVDTANVAGYIEIGRVWLGEATIEPAVSISYGATLGYESRESTTESFGGSIYGDGKLPKRIAVISFDGLVPTEKRKALIMQKVLTKTSKVLYMMDSLAVAEDMILEAFPALVRSASALTYPYYGVNEMPLEVMEALN